MSTHKGLWFKGLLLTMACTIAAWRGNAQCGGMQKGGQPAPCRVRAMVHGPVGSLTYDILAKRLDLSQLGQTGLLGASRYDVLIFDAKQLLHRLDKQDLNKDIEDALKSGHWVLGLDLTEEQKVSYFGNVVRASTKRSDSFYLVHRLTEPNGKYSWRIIGSHPIPKVKTPADSANLAELLYKHLSSRNPTAPPRVLKTPQGQSGSTSMPSGLPSTSWYFTIGGNPLQLPQPQRRSNADSQIYTMELDNTVTEYYDDVTAPGNPFQWLVTQTDFTLNPTNGTNYFANRTDLEQAFIPIQVISTLTPSSPTDFAMVNYSSPFPVPPPGQSAEWEYTSSNSGMITSFNFQSMLPNAGQLEFSQSNTCYDFSAIAWWNCDSGAPNPGYPDQNGPNQFSLSEETYSTDVTYTTNGVLYTQENVTSEASVDFLDLWEEYYTEHNFTQTWADATSELSIDMSSCASSSCGSSSFE